MSTINANSITERPAFSMNGFVTLLIATVAAIIALISLAEIGRKPWLIIITLGLGLLAWLLFTSVTMLQPGDARVVQFFGNYKGTVRRTGLVGILPLCTRRKMSTRVNNFETVKLKVNDADGNPVEIAAIIVWQVADTAKAAFAVENYASYVAVQSEAALRHVATSHPYDDNSGHGTSLRGSTDQVSAEMRNEVQQRVGIAGVEIIEVRISHLAYSPEIAQAMLQRQQAAAVVAARSAIVDGAVGMVEMALNRIEANGMVQLDDTRKAQMVSNLMLVLCGDSKATPVVNTELIK